jgi:foldase protein PrsA
VAEFEDAAYKLKKNEISEPVKSQFGYHIIQLLDKKEKESYEKMKADLEYDLKVSKIDAAKVQTILDQLVKDADVKINDKDLSGAVSTSSK